MHVILDDDLHAEPHVVRHGDHGEDQDEEIAGLGLGEADGIGNVTQNTGETTTLANTVRVNAEEKAMLKEMRDAGVKITAQFTMNDPEKDVGSLLD